jgi:hypothetical protein
VLLRDKNAHCTSHRFRGSKHIGFMDESHYTIIYYFINLSNISTLALGTRGCRVVHCDQ